MWSKQGSLFWHIFVFDNTIYSPHKGWQIVFHISRISPGIDIFDQNFFVLFTRLVIPLFIYKKKMKPHSSWRILSFNCVLKLKDKDFLDLTESAKIICVDFLLILTWKLILHKHVLKFYLDVPLFWVVFWNSKVKNLAKCSQNAAGELRWNPVSKSLPPKFFFGYDIFEVPWFYFKIE